MQPAPALSAALQSVKDWASGVEALVDKVVSGKTLLVDSRQCTVPDPLSALPSCLASCTPRASLEQLV